MYNLLCSCLLLIALKVSFSPTLSVILLTSFSVNLGGAFQEMEVNAEDAAINCLCLTHFVRPSSATVNFPACSPPIVAVWLTQHEKNSGADTSYLSDLYGCEWGGYWPLFVLFKPKYCRHCPWTTPEKRCLMTYGLIFLFDVFWLGMTTLKNQTYPIYIWRFVAVLDGNTCDASKGFDKLLKCWYLQSLFRSFHIFLCKKWQTEFKITGDMSCTLDHAGTLRHSWLFGM